MGAVSAFTLLLVLTAPAGASAGVFDLVLDSTGANGVGTITQPGLSCAEGGQGSYRHYLVSSQLPGGVLSKLEGAFRSSLDVHFSEVRDPTRGDQEQGVGAFLLGTETHATMSNARGAVQVRLASGDCQKPTLSYDGVTVAGTGTWTILPSGGTGAYRDATGAGTFSLQAALEPGADNPWAMALRGQLSILEPSLRVEVVRATWGRLGLDYLLRIVTVEVRITNDGPGDAFGARLLDATSPTAGVTPFGPVPQTLGDLVSGESEVVTLRFQLGLLAPCTAVILNCSFESVLTVDLPDALDRPQVSSASVTVTPPLLPPPLEEVA